jgi:predicted RND superfamily exporter protein
MRSLLEVLNRRPWLVVLAMGALCLAAATQIVDFATGQPRLLVDTSVGSLIPQDDEGRRFYDRVKELFGTDDTILVVLVDDDVFRFENLERVQRLTERFEELESVYRVSSLANALNIKSAGDELDIRPFLDDLADDPDELARIRHNALNDPIYAGNLVSRRGTASVIVVYPMDMTERELIERGVSERIGQIAREEAGDAKIWITGGSHVKSELNRLILHDLTHVIPVAILVVIMVGFLSFRTLPGALIPLSVVLIAIILTLGLISLTVGSLNVVTTIVPTLLVVVGFAYAIHVISAYYDALRGHLGHEDDPALAAVRHVALPVSLTGLTTAAGFFAMTTSSLGAIRQFGIFSGIGVILTTVITLTFAPALLRILKPRARSSQRSGPDWLDRLIRQVAHFDLQHRALIIGVAAALSGLALLGMFRIVVATDFIGNFDRDSQMRRDFDAVNAELEGASTFFVTIEAEYPDALKEPRNLRAIETLQEWLETQPEVGGTTSLVDYVKAINKGFNGDQAQYYAIPETSLLVSQLLLVGANEELENFVDTGFETANVVVRSSVFDSGAVSALVARVQERLKQLPGEIRGTATGNNVLLSQTSNDIAQGQALSLSTAFLIIYLILAALFTSFRVGAVALIPNALPVLAYFGILGWSGVTLNVTTGLVACMVLGIAVDDTIHLLSQFNRDAKTLASEEKGIVAALCTVGRPVTYTSAALCLGFATLLMAEVRSQVNFGLLAAVTLAIAWLADITFTPALALRMRIVTLWDVLTLDLGDRPEQSIPLFEGLSRAQARVAALMMEIRSFPQGFRLFTTGDPGAEMFVVIDGALQASVDAESGPLLLRTHERGDLVGEVALFQGRRTANVDTSSDVRLLRITPETLRHLHRRYPRIGSQLYQNLARILADRLANVTRRLQ